MKLICDNQTTLHISSNLVFHKRTKPNEVDCHFIRENIALRCMITSLSTLMTNELISSLSLSKVLGQSIYVTSLMHLTYMLHLEGEC